MNLVPGVLVLNAVFVAVGYALLSGLLRGLPLRTWASFGGLALLTGAGLTGVVLALLTVAGATASLAWFAGAAALTAALGLAGRTLLPRVGVASLELPAPRRRLSRAGAVLVTVSAFCVAAICTIALVGAFRSSPWLDDTWFLWLPKGVVLADLGLDERLFAPGPTYVHWETSDPLWWPLLTGIGRLFVGAIDLRAVNAQLTILLVAFVAALVRALWGRVRPAVLLPATLLLVAAPELLRHAQSGGADVPLAIYLVLFTLAAAGWLASGERGLLVLAFLFAAPALAL
jgi:hypothetical protein